MGIRYEVAIFIYTNACRYQLAIAQYASTALNWSGMSRTGYQISDTEVHNNSAQTHDTHKGSKHLRLYKTYKALPLILFIRQNPRVSAHTGDELIHA
jgi:hypothetical protein